MAIFIFGYLDMLVDLWLLMKVCTLLLNAFLVCLVRCKHWFNESLKRHYVYLYIVPLIFTIPMYIF